MRSQKAGLGGIAGLVTAAFAGIAGAAPGDPAKGEAMFGAVCAECHAVAGDIAAKMQGADDAAQTAWLDGFLVNHFVPDEQARQDMAAYLLSVRG